MKGFLIFILSIILFYFIYPFSVLYTFFKLLFTDFKGLNDWFLEMAVGIDQFGNVSGKELLKDLFIKEKVCKDRFGKVDETISSVIGKNKKEQNLSFFGKMIDFILNLFESNHSIKSIEYDE